MASQETRDAAALLDELFQETANPITVGMAGMMADLITDVLETKGLPVTEATVGAVLATFDHVTSTLDTLPEWAREDQAERMVRVMALGAAKAWVEVAGSDETRAPSREFDPTECINTT